MLTRGAENCAKRKSTSPCLLAIPASDRIAGLCTIHPNSNGEYANANDFGVRLKALTDLARNECLVGPGLIVGGISFGWLADWVLSPDRLSRKPGDMRILSGVQVKPPRLGERHAGRVPICIVDPGICLTTEGKSRKNFIQGVRKALGYTAPVRFV